MKRSTTSVTALLIACLALFLLLNPLEFSPQVMGTMLVKPDTTKITENEVKEKEGVDVTQEAIDMNGPDKPQPPTEFRAGHVTSTTLDNYLTETDNGFIVKLPGNSNTPTPTYYEGKLYVGGGFSTKTFYSFDAVSGQIEWGINLDDDGPSTPAVAEDIAVFNTESCTIFAVDTKTGKQLWSHWMGDPMMSMPTISNGIVYTSYPALGKYGKSVPGNGFNNHSFEEQFMVEDIEEEVFDVAGDTTNSSEQVKTVPKLQPTHVLAALELKTGKIIWQKWINGDVMSAPVIMGSELYATTFAGTVYKFDPVNGEILSAKATGATSAPIMDAEGELWMSYRSDNDEIVGEAIGSFSKDMIVMEEFNQKDAPYLDHNVQDKSNLKKESTSLDAGNGFSGGAPLTAGAYTASRNIGQSNVSSLQSFQGSRVLYHDGKAYSTMGNEVICINPATGDSIWNYKLDGDLRTSGGFMGTPPISVGGYIIVATLQGEINIIDALSGEVEKQYKTGEQIRYQPIVQHGWIYVTTTNGKLVAINTQKDNLTGWPTWGGNAERSNQPLSM